MIRLACFCLAAAALSAQQPDFVNARLETHAVTGTLASEFQQLRTRGSSPMWVAYSVPMVPGRHGSMCGEDSRNRKLLLEGPDTLIVLFRLDQHAVERVRTATPDCEIDAGGLPVVLLTGVIPAQSVELLAGLVSASTAKGHLDPLVSAIALHRDAAADRAMESLLASSQPESAREKALFWMAAARGRSGFEAVRKVLQNDPSDRMREKATFDITLGSEPEAVAALQQSAKSDSSPRVRKQALFWLAHKAGAQEIAFIANAAQQDPDPEVRRHAVFALEQVPQGKGIPEMIRLAKTSSDPKVKQQAVFWLGRSKDPQALHFFEDVLK